MQVFYKCKNKIEFLDKKLQNALLPEQHYKKYQSNFMLKLNGTRQLTCIFRKKQIALEEIHMWWNMKDYTGSLGWVAQLPRALARTPTGYGFNPSSKHIPRLYVRSPIRARMGGNPSMFLSHISVSLSLPSSLSKIHILWWGFKKKVYMSNFFLFSNLKKAV